MAIYVTGDTHGSSFGSYYGVDGFMHRFNTDFFPKQRDLTKNDYVVICGDFGGVWSYKGEIKEEKYSLDWLESKPFTTLFVPGNHENYDRLTGIPDEKVLDCWIYKNCTEDERNQIRTGYPQKLWHGGMVRELRPSVLMLERGYVFDICGAKCFAFGGARSHDIQHGILKAEEYPDKKSADKEYDTWCRTKNLFRVNHISWWEQEMPNQMEMERGWAMLEDEKYKVDFIFSHDCPSSDIPFILPGRASRTDELNRYFEEIKQKVDYQKWMFGHYHDNLQLPGDKDILLYEQMIRII